MSAKRPALLLSCLLALGHASGVARAQQGPTPAAQPAPVPESGGQAGALGTQGSTPVPAPATPVAPAAAPAASDTSGASEAATSPAVVATSASEPVAPAPSTASAAESEPAAPDSDRLGIDVHLGFGFGTKRYERPLADGTAQVLPHSAFAAVDTGLRVHLPACGRMSLSAALRYRSSLGYRVEESPLFALTAAQDVRVQRLELSARTSYRFGDGGWSPALGVELGVVIASFVPELHERLTPKYALAGPVLRPIGRVEPLDWLTLQVGPEVTWIALVDGTLGDDGAGDQGVAVGAEASARARLFEGLALELDYRASLAMIDSEGGFADFKDVERFVTLDLVGEL